MDEFLRLPASQRASVYERVGDEMGVAASAIEKDLWVCWALRELFRSETGPHLAFKGGTSLSKCFGLIERFSEDIDVVIARGHLGFGGDNSPESLRGRPRERRIESLLEACRAHVRGITLPSLQRIAARLGDELVGTPELDENDLDLQTVLIPYRSALEGGGYIRPVVKIELGARSDTEPSERRPVRPYAGGAFAGESWAPGFEVRVVAPERTFWEKISLLHEENHRQEAPSSRLARHYYDLWCLERGGVAERAMRDFALFERVAEHRRIFFRRQAQAQADLKPGTVRLVPSSEALSRWKSDYQAMVGTMFFRAPPDFVTIIASAERIEERINRP